MRPSSFISIFAYSIFFLTTIVALAMCDGLKAKWMLCVVVVVVVVVVVEFVHTRFQIITCGTTAIVLFVFITPQQGPFLSN